MGFRNSKLRNENENAIQSEIHTISALEGLRFRVEGFGVWGLSGIWLGA